MDRTAQQTHKRLVAAGLIALMTLLWTVAEILPTLLSPGYSLFQVVWVRYGTHILLMLLLLAPRQGLSLLRTRRPGLQIGRGLLMIVMPASFIFSLGMVRGADVMAVFWLTPLLMLAFAALILRERQRWAVWAAAAAGAVGAALILRPDAGLLRAAPYGLGMAVSFSLYVVLTRSLRTERTSTNLFYSALVVFVPLTLAMPAIWQPLGLRDALLMAGVGVVGLAVLWCIDRATELVPIGVLAPIVPLQLTLITVLPSLLAGVRPPWLAVGGSLLIAGAALAGLVTPGRPSMRVEPGSAAAGLESS